MLVEDLMKTNVVTLPEDATIKNAVDVMKQHHIRHIPIVQNGDCLIGIVSDRDVKEAIPSTLCKQDGTIYETQLAEIMTKNPITGHPMDFVEEVAVIFYNHHIGCLPIVSQHKLVGIITETDLLYKFIELTGAHQPGSQIEVRVPNRPGILYEVSKVFHDHQTNVLSVLVYPDKKSEQYKILVIRIKTMNPLIIIDSLKNSGFEVLWPNFPGSIS